MKYKVCIEETVSEEFEVEAETPEQALEIADEKYNNCEFVLEPGELIGKKMCVTSPEEKRTEWVSF